MDALKALLYSSCHQSAMGRRSALTAGCYGRGEGSASPRFLSLTVVCSSHFSLTPRTPASHSPD